MALCALRFKGGGDTERSSSSAGRFLVAAEGDTDGAMCTYFECRLLPGQDMKIRLDKPNEAGKAAQSFKRLPWDSTQGTYL